MVSLYSDLDHRFRKVPVMTKVMKIILITLLVVVLAGAGLIWYVLGSMRSGAVETIEKPTEDVSVAEQPEVITVISDEPTPSPTPMPIYAEESKEDSIVNILLVGTDSRSESELESSEGRSDSMMLASLNKEKGTITLISFMRDSRVHRIGKSGRFTFYNRLNGAYSGGYGGGGPGELINTLNENFDLDIQEYICIGFDGFAALIDQVRREARGAAAGSSVAGVSPVAERVSEKLMAKLAISGGASAAAAAVGGMAGIVISFGAAGFGAIAHEIDRPEMEAQLRKELNTALDDMWHSLMEDPDIGVMGGVNHIAERIEMSVADKVANPAGVQPVLRDEPIPAEPFLLDEEGIR